MRHLLGMAPVAFLAAGQGTDLEEIAHPWQAVIARGGLPVLVSPSPDEIELCRTFSRAATMRVDIPVADADPASFAGLVLPGGVVNPDRLRANVAAVDFVRTFFATGLPVAAIGHAPWLLIEAGVAAGRRLTSCVSLRTDLRNAGADWADDHVVACRRGPNTLVTGRMRRDLPRFCDTFTRLFSARA